MEVESKAQEFDLPTDRSSWGWGGLNEKELRSLIAANDDEQMMLCANCDVNL